MGNDLESCLEQELSVLGRFCLEKRRPRGWLSHSKTLRECSESGGIYLIWGRTYWNCASWKEVGTNSGILLRKDGNTLGECDFPVIRVFIQREEVNMWACMHQRGFGHQTGHQFGPNHS